MDERKSVEGTNVARDKPRSTGSSTRLEHAVWQDGSVVLFLLPAPLAHAASARPDPRGRRPKTKDLWYAPAGFS